jgi:hypothetical protein
VRPSWRRAASFFTSGRRQERSGRARSGSSRRLRRRRSPAIVRFSGQLVLAKVNRLNASGIRLQREPGCDLGHWERPSFDAFCPCYVGSLWLTDRTIGLHAIALHGSTS